MISRNFNHKGVTKKQIYICIYEHVKGPGITKLEKK
jgi:hypothetical protein